MPETAPRKRRDLTLDEIVDRSSAIMAAEGEAALTMRRVAQECGVTAMAIYHHVDDKEALLTLVVDRAIGSILTQLPDRVDWREEMTNIGCEFRRVFIDNPGAATVFLRRPVVSPNLAIVTEHMFAIFDHGGIRGPAAAEALDAVVLLTMGSIANDLSRPPEIRFELLNHAPPDSVPLMAEHIEPYAQRDGEARYRVALGWLLDGIERTAS